jgi:hypothetical protein
MMRASTVWIWVAITCLVGVCFAQLATRSVPLREKLGTWSGRGHLLALVHGRGIYQADVDRAVAESRDLAGIEDGETTVSDRQSALSELIANCAARSRAARQRIPWIKWKREADLLRWQFRDDKTWWSILQNNSLNFSSVLPILGGDLRARQWISKQISREVDVTEDECRRFYESHPEDFFMTERVRVSHLFLAAPPETSPEIVETKRLAIEALSVRLVGGEDFDTLAAENSEDEATKLRRGDLGYLSADRMPPDFVAAALKLRPGEISAPIRTRLGFHIIKLIDTQPAHQRTFEEARREIAIELENEKRAAAVQNLIVDLRSETAFFRSF